MKACQNGPISDRVLSGISGLGRAPGGAVYMRKDLRVGNPDNGVRIAGLIITRQLNASELFRFLLKPLY